MSSQVQSFFFVAAAAAANIVQMIVLNAQAIVPIEMYDTDVLISFS